MADRATPNGARQIFARAGQLDPFPTVLANNADVGMYGEFPDQDVENIRSLLFEGRSSVIAGRLNGVMALASLLLSRRFTAQTTSRMARK